MDRNFEVARQGAAHSSNVTSSSPQGRQLRYDVLRLLATFMVIAHHFDTHIPAYLDEGSYLRPFYDGLGSNLFHGHLAVAIFFMLSGFFSYRTLSAANFDAFRWVKKRIGRLLIPLWLAWPIGYGVLLLAGTLVQGDAKIAPLAVLGLDGYLTTYFSIRSWHVVGEWYTGALILVILVMPLLRCVMRRWGVSKCFAGLLCFELVVGLISCGAGTDIFLEVSTRLRRILCGRNNALPP